MSENFPVKKILKMSLKDYLEMVEKDLKDYIPEGVHWAQYQHNLGDVTMQQFSKKVPEGTEVVVNYELQLARTDNSVSYFQSGLALIPKK
ncbi:MAG: hypothetical protein ABIB71_03920 [Candidatus Woesearchaeota archaeon]